MTKLVVIGGDAAGMSAAAQANRGVNRPDIVVFESGDYTSYAACGLPYFVGSTIEEESDLVVRSPEAHRANGIDVRTRHEVLSIDADARTVKVRSLDEDRVVEESFDHLLIAAGASPLRPPLPNIDSKGIFALKTIPDAVAIDKAIAERQPKEAVVVGGGYIGLEVAEALVDRGLRVTLVELLDQPMSTLDPDMGERVAAGMEDLGVELRLGVGVRGFHADDDGWVRAVETDNGQIPADLVVVGLGVRPNTELASDAGVRIGQTGAIATDARMATSVEGIWAAGDCAESLHRVSHKPVAIALGTHANKQGRVVGLNVSGTSARFPGVIGTAMTKIGSMEIALTGLNERDAAAAGFDAVSKVIEDETRAHYYPGGAPIAVKVLAERHTGRMLGAQIVGGPESAKRIDALAVAIWNEMTAKDFAEVDLGYVPPLSPTIDPILIAARIAAKAARKPA